MLEEKEKDKDKEKPPNINEQDYFRNYSKENPFYYERKLYKFQQLSKSESIIISMCLYKYSLKESQENPVETKTID